jgi:penicillin G amidase
MRWVGWILLLFLIVIAAVLLWLRVSLPGPGATVALKGLSAPVSIVRDRYGIPTITAGNERDAVFALGFMHAKERLFQMELTRRAGAGRLAELFGAVALPTDKFMRTLGLYRASEAQYQAMPEAARATLMTYADGVNAWIAQRRSALPPEYYLVGARPEPWRPVDSLVWNKLMDLQLAGNFRDELFRARLAQHMSPEDMAVLYPPPPKNTPPITGDVAALLKTMPLDAIYAALPDQVGPIFESNNWVVDGKHTVSGKPMLANDPHLALNAPGVWYLAHLVTPELDIAGVTSPGSPFIVLGHNKHIAWGFTDTIGDVEDVYVEKLDPKDPNRYLTPDGSQPFVTRAETIAVHGEAAVQITVRETRHGPVISDLGGAYRDASPQGAVLAAQIAWLMPGDRTPEALVGINHAHNWNEFRDATKLFGAPEQNMVYADIDGHIGFIAPARVPIRAKGDGFMPVPGWTDEYKWTGFIPFDELPQGYDPPSGRFATANAKIVPDDYPHFISRDWDYPNRLIRINQLLDAKPKFAPADFAAIQADTYSIMAHDLVPLFTAAPPANDRAAQAIALLKSWNFRMDRDEVGPLIFIAWLREATRQLLEKKMGNEFAEFWAARPLVVRDILTAHRDWCAPDGGKPGDCDAVLATSLSTALEQLSALYGEDMSGWRWGSAHRAHFVNQFWSNVPLAGRLFALDLPTDGGPDTINRGEMRFRDEADPFAHTAGPGLRTIVDMAAPSEAGFLITPGQAASPLSPHYSDLMQGWRDFHWLRFDHAGAAEPLLLTPQS